MSPRSRRRWPGPQSAALAVLLLCGSGRVAWVLAREARTSAEPALSELLLPLTRALDGVPAGVPLGFLGDAPFSRLDDTLPAKRYLQLAALAAPRLVLPDAGHEWVLLWLSDPGALDGAAARLGLELRARAGGAALGRRRPP